jgi:hypothetical protein
MGADLELPKWLFWAFADAFFGFSKELFWHFKYLFWAFADAFFVKENFLKKCQR